MLSDIYDLQFQNWIKGVLVIRETRSALCAFVLEKMENTISSMSETERRHLPSFILCLNENNVKHLKTFEKVRRRTWKCDHSVCETLMKHMIDLHASPIKTDCKWTFDIDMQPRNSLSLEEDATEMTEEKEREVIWAIIQLFMYGEMEKGNEKGKSLDDLDISKIVKMMRNCTLFTFDDSERLYENVIAVRNELMHSADNKVRDERMHDIFGQLKEFLKLINETATTSFTSTLNYLDHMEENSFSITYQSKEYKEIAKTVLKIKKIALDLDTSLENSGDKIKSKTEVLKQLLDEATKNISEADFEDNGVPLNLQPADYKHIVKSTIEMKKEALAVDIQTCESTGESSSELQVLKEETLQQLEVLKESIRETDLEELVNSLSKQVESLTAECNEYKTEIQKYTEQDSVEQSEIDDRPPTPDKDPIRRPDRKASCNIQ